MSFLSTFPFFSTVRLHGDDTPRTTIWHASSVCLVSRVTCETSVLIMSRLLPDAYYIYSSYVVHIPATFEDTKKNVHKDYQRRHVVATKKKELKLNDLFQSANVIGGKVHFFKDIKGRKETHLKNIWVKDSTFHCSAQCIFLENLFYPHFIFQRIEKYRINSLA